MATIEDLEKRIIELEKKLNKENTLLFGRSYGDVGNVESDLILKTRGLIKIQYGSKFIDLIKDGKLNVETSFIYKQNEIGTEDGIYVIDDKVVLLVNGETVNLGGESSNTYISFLEKLDNTPDQKYQALQNIGFIYKTLSDVPTVNSGVVYVEDSKKLYFISDGVIQTYSASLPDEFNKTLVFNTSGNAIEIKGKKDGTGIVFDSFKIYRDINSAVLGTTDIPIYLNSGSASLQIHQTEIRTNRPIYTLKIYGDNFQIYDSGEESTLYVDNIVSASSQHLPVGTIIMYNGTDIPNNWAICDGENGTPNLIGKFIKAGTESGMGESTLETESVLFLKDEITEDSEIVSAVTSISKAEPEYYSLIFIMKIK